MKQTLAIPGVGFTKIDQSLLADIEKFFGLTAPMICEADRSSPGEEEATTYICSISH